MEGEGREALPVRRSFLYICTAKPVPQNSLVKRVALFSLHSL